MSGLGPAMALTRRSSVATRMAHEFSQEVCRLFSAAPACVHLDRRSVAREKAPCTPVPSRFSRWSSGSSPARARRLRRRGAPPVRLRETGQRSAIPACRCSAPQWDIHPGTSVPILDAQYRSLTTNAAPLNSTSVLVARAVVPIIPIVPRPLARASASSVGVVAIRADWGVDLNATGGSRCRWHGHEDVPRLGVGRD